MEDKEIVLAPAISNKMIESLTHKAALQTFKNHLLLCDVSINETEFASLTRAQLHTELKTFRNDLIKKHSQPTSNNQPGTNPQSQPDQEPYAASSNTPSTTSNTNQQKNPSLWKQRVQNRNGININLLAPSTQNETMRDDAAPNLDKQFNVVQQQNNLFYLRANLPVKDHVTHTPTIVRSFFGVLRQADPSILLLPFDYNNKSSQYVIEKESAIPNDEKFIKKWVSGFRSKNNNEFRTSSIK